MMVFRGGSAALGWCASALLASYLPIIFAQQYSPPADANVVFNADVDSIFRHTTVEKERMINQALSTINAMITAPTCTRMAAHRLMKECKFLDNAPEFAKDRPEPYLDHIKSEYAAKLALCELRSAEPNFIPPYCEIAVATPEACDKRRFMGRWFSQSDIPADKICYPDMNDYRLTQCLRTLQSNSVYWTSYSNARQNAVVMCQASRDAIEREKHLETFKNLTQVMNRVSQVMDRSAEDFSAWLDAQGTFAEEIRKSQEQVKQNMQDMQEKALSTVGSVDDKFQSFMKTTMADLIIALEQDQGVTISRLRDNLLDFAKATLDDNTRITAAMKADLQSLHQMALLSTQINHNATMESHHLIQNSADGILDKHNDISNQVDQTLSNMNNISQLVDVVGSKTEFLRNTFDAFRGVKDAMKTIAMGLAVITAFFLLYWMTGKHITGYVLATCILSGTLSYFIASIWLVISTIHNDSLSTQSEFLFPAFFMDPSSRDYILLGTGAIGGTTIVLVVIFSQHIYSLIRSLICAVLFKRIRDVQGQQAILPNVQIPTVSTNLQSRSLGTHQINVLHNKCRDPSDGLTSCPPDV